MDEQTNNPGRLPSVVIVDDQPTFLELARLIVTKGKVFHVSGEARDGAECLAMAERVRPDIVLLDIELPDGDGIQLCRKLLRLYPQMAVVIMSAHSEDIFRDEAMRAGARGFIRKHELSATRLKQALAHPIEG